MKIVVINITLLRCEVDQGIRLAEVSPPPAYNVELDHHTSASNSKVNIIGI